jgi:hypothetical protein
MRKTLQIGGGLLVAIGIVWTLQGAGWLKGSFMTGEALWLWIGIACILAGLPLLARGLRRG